MKEEISSRLFQYGAVFALILEKEKIAIEFEVQIF